MVSDDLLNPVDVLSIVAVLLLAAVVGLFRRQLGDDAGWLLGILFSVLLFIGFVSLVASRRREWRVVHAFSPIVVIIVLFSILGPIIRCVRPLLWDAFFAQLDAQIFGTLAERWRNVLGRPAWFTDLTYLAYLSYYLAPVVVVAALYRAGDEERFRSVVFRIAFTFYASYVGYFLFPTFGPRVPLGREAAVIGGGYLSQGVRLFLHYAERTLTDAFPSGHTAIALLCLYFAWQISGTLFVLLVPAVIGIIFSTVYLHYHYVVDVVAGIVMAIGCGWLGPRIEPAFEPRGVRRWLALRFGMR